MPARLTDSALRDLYAACAPTAHRRARDLLGSDADAWDAVHEVFARLAEGDLFAAVSAKPMAYIYRATTNVCLDALAARRVRARTSPGETAEVPGGAEAVHARDLLAKLDAQLDQVDRQILILSVYDGLPQERIADILGIWRRTVGRRLVRLRELALELERAPLEKIS